MANTSAPFGFRPVKSLGGRDATFGQEKRRIAYNDTAALYIGDPVTSLASGLITRATAGTTTIAGIFLGCQYLSQSLGYVVESPVWPGNDAASTTVVTAYICNDPTALLEVQAGGSTTAIGVADIGANIQFALGTPDTRANTSGAYVDQTTIATTNTLPFRIVDLITTPPGANGTDITTGYNRVIVAFNNQDFKTNTGV
jgi:hypothetical protein